MDHGTGAIACKYFKNVGACALGDSCIFAHILPMTSCTVLIHNMYWTPYNVGPFFMPDRSEKEKRKHFELFYEDIFVEMSTKYGRIMELAVAENLCDHLVGSVWVRFESPFSAQQAVRSMNNRWFAGRPLHVELCPVKRVQDAKCNYETCLCEPFCSYLHVQKPPSHLVARLFEEQDALESEEDMMEGRGIPGSRNERDGYDQYWNGGPYRNYHGATVKRYYSPYEYYSSSELEHGNRESDEEDGPHFRRNPYSWKEDHLYRRRHHRMPAGHNSTYSQAQAYL